MKTLVQKIVLLLLLVMVSVTGYSQNQQSPLKVVVVKENGVKYVGELVSQDAREVLLKTEDLGEIYIPRYVIKEIKPYTAETGNRMVTDELFATRYFITTNGLPIAKGENYIQWNLYGPDFQFGVADNLGVGIMTSWAAIPIIGNIKYSINLGKNKSMALGLLAGTGSWAMPEFGLILPFVSFTLGNRRNNLTLSTGYGKLFYQDDTYNYSTGNYEDINRSEGRVLLSIAGMAKISEKFSLVFDTFISPWGPEYTQTDWVDNGYWTDKGEYISNYQAVTTTRKSPNLALILPGIRWQLEPNKAFQFGFTGFYYDGEFMQFPIPMVQWYRRL